ncbi:MAG TPA: helicase, partial [Hyphomicrobiales bacterium]|nr:helicase [Hyphomicrobiales bacterium]
ASHAELVATLYKYIMSDEGLIPEDWFASQVEQADRTDGDIDTLSNRISHIRTWTFVSNRREWLKDPDYWQGKTREIEDRLSDALHEQLTQRFVDKRTSVLMRSMRDKESLFAEIEKDGRVVVERHYVGKLVGFCFTPDAAAAGVHGKAARNAAAKVLVHELAARSDRLAAAADTAFTLTRDGKVIWEGQEIGILSASDDPLKPNFLLNSDEHLAAIDKANITSRIESWLDHHIEVRLKPLVDIAKAEDISGLARGIAFRLRENFGILRRETVAEEIKSLDQEGRAQLRKYGVRFGAHNIYFPLLLKPVASDLLLLLWLLKHGSEHNFTTAAIADSPRQGLTSVPRNPALPEAFYRAAGFHVCGPRAVRVDMLERLADMIRPLIAWRPAETAAEPPPGAAGGGAFKVRPEMMSIMGCSVEELGLILESLGFRKERRPIKRSPQPEVARPQPGQAPANDNNPPGSPAKDIAEPEAASGAIASDAAASSDAGVEGPSAGESEAGPPEVVLQVTAATPAQNKEAPQFRNEEAPQPGDVAAVAALEQSGPVQASETEPEFEELWRFRRPRPKLERGEGRVRRHQRHAGGDRGQQQRHHRPRREGDARTGGKQSGDGQKDRPGSPARHEQRRAQPHGHDHGDRRKEGIRDAGREQSAEKKEAAAASQASAQPQHSKSGDRQDRAAHRSQRHDHGSQRAGGGRPPHQRGKFIAASASPKKPSGGIDPDSPFAALSQLKERLEKQVQTQDEAV